MYLNFSEESDSFTEIEDSFTHSYFGFGTFVSGYEFSGNVCLTKDACLPDFTFVKVRRQ